MIHDPFHHQSIPEHCLALRYYNTQSIKNVNYNIRDFQSVRERWNICINELI